MNQGKTFFIHLRARTQQGISNTGGSTVAYRETADGGIEYAEAWCNPSDNFCREQGRVKSAGRLNSPRYMRKVANISEKDFRAGVYSGQLVL